MKKIILLSLCSLGLGLVTLGCLKEPGLAVSEPVLNLPEQPYQYAGVEIPEHIKGEFQRFGNDVFENLIVERFPEFGQEPEALDIRELNKGRIGMGMNPIVTNEGATLGRVLFYDPKLSINNSVSCAGCHRQEAAFSDPAQFSTGFGGKITPRNSMAIVNSALNNNLFWDSRVPSVSQLVLEPVQNHIEMGMESIETLEKKLTGVSYYPDLFAQAFGDPAVSGERIADALAQFVCSMVSVNSKFDKGIHQNFSNFTELEKLGMALFNSERTQCSGCHSGGNFAAADFPGGEYGEPGVQGTASIGLDLSPADPGLNSGKFRIPSLRNVFLTAPYMHDGRFQTLEEVIEHYNAGIQAHPGLDAKLKDERGLPRRMNLNALEKKAIIAFLHTLTDQSLTREEKFSDPFTN